MIKSKYICWGAIVSSVLLFAGYKFFYGIKKHNVLAVGTCSGFPPYEMLDKNGTIVGFDIDVAHAIAQAIGKELEVHDMSFDSLIVALQQGKIDCAIAAISITPKRQQEIAMVHYIGNPLTALPVVFWNEIPAGVHTINDLTALANKTICAQVGTLQQEVISSYKGIEVKYLENIADLIMDIKYGKSIAAVLEPKVVAALQMEYPALKTLLIPLDKDKQDFGSGIGINKNNKQLIDDVSSIITALKSNGVLETLEKKWFKEGA